MCDKSLTSRQPEKQGLKFHHDNPHRPYDVATSGAQNIEQDLRFGHLINHISERARVPRNAQNNNTTHVMCRVVQSGFE